MKIVLLADTDMKRTRGLMYHRPLEKNECAFFDFPREGQHTFWNKNVDFPISLIFCNASGEVLDIKRLNAQQTRSIKPDVYDIKYVIESHIDAPNQYRITKGRRMIKNDNEVVFK